MCIRLGRVGFIALSVAMMAGCLGCGGGGGGGGTGAGGGTDGGGGGNFLSPVPPVVTGTTLNPTYMTAAGGDITIQAQVTDDTGVSAVNAIITLPDGGTATVTMTGQGTYSGAYTVPSNRTGSNQKYSVSVTAKDMDNLTASGATVSFNVLSIDTPPPPPPFE